MPEATFNEAKRSREILKARRMIKLWERILQTANTEQTARIQAEIDELTKIAEQPFLQDKPYTDTSDETMERDAHRSFMNLFNTLL